ncbi:MAG: 1-deoxy-D-xylulose-5-phosphate reductoisomerase [Gammaproteobacteria bacterium RIFOXYA12_FULL_61_12]|nr:MAG: 1-deoxy-D-xylulose-5-phosphate reductoisomerase [Gammaproteobacteria bacterium RIFOXYD12_FULL_61_37]OGT94194.1 MAG: 1-deoxy-D-xylulose-5-phosphate reductoisomerase [Gammaproteobacteria bacterium RIFOXYA12_FULL_61_12]
MIGICILGSTGSIGVSTLDVVGRHPDRYRVVALTAQTHVERLHQQCLAHRPRFAVMGDPAAAERLRGLLAGTGIEVLEGVAGLEQAAAHPDVHAVMAAIVGAAGLLPALAAVRAGKRLLLANKEALVVSGRLFMEEAARHGAQILPIDSEHNAVFQCMPADYARGLEQVGVRRILLTASGGPFRTTAREDLAQVTPEQACAHPNWSMGRKISVDSATMMNKGLEVIEACWLFATRPEQVQVVVHPQSVIHSLVEYVDGSVLAQLGNPDMRTPIAHALAWPERIASGVAPLDLFAVARLDFEPPDLERFPCLRLAYEAVTAGGGMPAVLNAANEVAVEAFLDRRLPFMVIPSLIEETLGRIDAAGVTGLGDLLDLDRRARELAWAGLGRFSS